MFGKKKDASKPEQERKTDKKPQQAAFRERLKSAVKTKHFRLGTYTAATAAIVLAILVAINLLVSALPETYTNIVGQIPLKACEIELVRQRDGKTVDSIIVDKFSYESTVQGE